MSGWKGIHGSLAAVSRATDSATATSGAPCPRPSCSWRCGYAQGGLGRAEATVPDATPVGTEAGNLVYSPRNTWRAKHDPKASWHLPVP